MSGDFVDQMVIVEIVVLCIVVNSVKNALQKRKDRRILAEKYRKSKLDP